MDNKLLDIKAKPNKQLTYKQQRFVDEYLLDGNANRACIRAGILPEEEYQNGRASDLLRQTSHELMHNVHIKQEIDRRAEEIRDVSIMDAKEILQLYTSIARGEVLDQFGLEPSLKDRITALNELSKRLIDFKPKEAVDNQLTVKLIR